MWISQYRNGLKRVIVLNFDVIANGIPNICNVCLVCFHAFDTGSRSKGKSHFHGLISLVYVGFCLLCHFIGSHRMER